MLEEFAGHVRLPNIQPDALIANTYTKLRALLFDL